MNITSDLGGFFNNLNKEKKFVDKATPMNINIFETIKSKFSKLNAYISEKNIQNINDNNDPEPINKYTFLFKINFSKEKSWLINSLKYKLNSNLFISTIIQGITIINIAKPVVAKFSWENLKKLNFRKLKKCS